MTSKELGMKNFKVKLLIYIFSIIALNIALTTIDIFGGNNPESNIYNYKILAQIALYPIPYFLTRIFCGGFGYFKKYTYTVLSLLFALTLSILVNYNVYAGFSGYFGLVESPLFLSSEFNAYPFSLESFSNFGLGLASELPFLFIIAAASIFPFVLIHDQEDLDLITIGEKFIQIIKNSYYKILLSLVVLEFVFDLLSYFLGGGLSPIIFQSSLDTVKGILLFHFLFYISLKSRTT